MPEEYRSSTVGRPRSKLPLLLVGLGLLILTAKAGPFGSALWSVAWPIVLIAFGIDLITEGRQRRRIGVAALLGMVVLGPVVGGARFVDSAGPGADGPRQAGMQPELVLRDVDRLRAQITQTAGTLSIRALSQSSENVASVGRDGQINSYTTEDRTGVLEVAPGGSWHGGDLDLRLTRRVPLDLTVDVAAGSAEPLDFEDLQLEKLNLTVRAGQAEIKLPERGVIDVTINGGIGNVEIEVPDELAARIELASSIGDAEYDEDRFQNQDGVLLSQGYSEDAPNRVTIHVTNSAGNIEIK